MNPLSQLTRQPLCGLLLLALPGLASADAGTMPTQLDTVVVVARRAPEPLAQVVSSVSVVDREATNRGSDKDRERTETPVKSRLPAFFMSEIGRGRSVASGGKWSLIPALRIEDYRLDARPDSIFVEDYPDTVTVDADSRKLTGKFGLRYALSAQQNLFLQYAQGFRAPPFSDLNIGLSLALLNYEVRANPDLKPERSEGIELGWRGQWETWEASVSVYDNHYRDLIESRANLGIDPLSGATVFQSINRARARIRGAEADLRWSLDRSPADAWTLRAALAWSEGEDTRLNRPLNSIDPAELVLGLRYAPVMADWGAEWISTATQRMDQIDHTAMTLFEAPGHAVHDLLLWWTPRDDLRLQFGVFNLSNRRYWSWSTARGLRADSSQLGFIPSPGAT